MKPTEKDTERQIQALSYDAVKKRAGDLTLDAETKQRILDKTLRRIGVKHAVLVKSAAGMAPVGRRRSAIRLKKPMVVAAALVLALSMGVGSIVGAGSVTKSFGQIFHSLPESHYKDIIFDIQQSQTDNGVTVTLTQGMCDGTALYVIERVDFAPSVVTLTDELFDESDGYRAPYFAVEEVTHPENSRIAVECGFVKLLEHDAHSVTYLKTFGGGTSTENVDDFFRNNTKIVMNLSGLGNLQKDDETYDCRFQFAFDVRLCEPTVYNLPEKTYQYDESIPYAGYENYPDVWVNPWYMRIAPACVTGKRIDTSLAGSKPALAITLNDGTVYTDGNGILVGGNPSQKQDLLGKEYDRFNDIYCTFDTEVDVTNIKSIKLFGCDMTAATVPAPKPVEKQDSVRQELPATDPVTFPENEHTLDVTEFKVTRSPEGNVKEEDIPAGTMKYRIKHINVYDNLYAAGADRKDIMKIAIEDGKFIFYDENGKLYGRNFGQACDVQTGKLSDGFYLVEYELELTNIDSYLSEFYENFFYPEVYCNYSDMPDEVDSTYGVPLVYIRENNRKQNGQNDSFTLRKGQTRTLHIGFIVPDNGRGSLGQLGLRVHGEASPVYVNITKAVENLKKK